MNNSNQLTKIYYSASLITFLFLYIQTFALADTCPKKYHLVSDFDHTIKLYHTDKTEIDLLDALLITEIYPGIDLLYQELLTYSSFQESQDCINNNFLSIVTASPKIFKKSALKLLKENNFPKFKISFRNLFYSRFTHKINTLTKIKEQSDTPLIIIGDDSGNDPEIFNRFSIDNPQTTITTYIHSIKNRELFDNQIGYYTIF